MSERALRGASPGCFTTFPWAPTLEGQYIVKNVVIVASAIVLGATVRGGQLTAEPPRHR